MIQECKRIMKEELEICVRAKESFNEVYKKMLNLGFHIQEDFILKDIYMVPNDISISLEFEITDHNILMSNGKNEIYIQDVKGVGTYIEMEQNNLLLKNNNGNNIEEMKNTLNSYNLNIDDNDYFVRKAADVLKSIL